MVRYGIVLLGLFAMAACSSKHRIPWDEPPSHQSISDAVPYRAPVSTLEGAPTQEYLYLVPLSENACAPEPQEFISAAGMLMFRTKDCVRQEYVYLPATMRARIDALNAQCRARCQTK